MVKKLPEDQAPLDILNRMADGRILAWQHFKQVMVAAHSHYDQCGVAYMKATTAARLKSLLDTSAETYWRRVAKDAGRPFLYAEEIRVWSRNPQGWVDSIELSMPRSERMHNVAGSLLVLSGTGTLFNNYHEATGVVERQDTERTWTFRFYGDEGRELFADLVSRCRTDPILRIVLKLPPLPTP